MKNDNNTKCDWLGIDQQWTFITNDGTAIQLGINVPSIILNNK